MWALKEISRKDGTEKTIKTTTEMSDAWSEMIRLNAEKCDGFSGKGYGYGKKQGMRGVMYYVDGSEGVVYDITNLDYTDLAWTIPKKTT